MKSICFDIDGVICKTNKNNYKQSKPIKKNILLINKLYDKGYKIKIFTARYMGRYNDNYKKAYARGYKSTFRQLKKWNLKFHILYMGKPSFDILIDDKAINFNKNWSKNLIKKIQ